MRRFLPIILAVLLMVGGCGAGGLNRPRQRAWNATFALFGHANGRSHFLCTATAVKRIPTGYQLLTAGHCVDPKGLQAPETITFTVSETLDYLAPEYPVTVLKYATWPNSLNRDYAILEFTTKRHYPVETIGNKDFPTLEEPVYFVHFAEAVTKQISEGRISTKLILNFGGDGTCPICPNRILIQGVAGDGASGSLVISARNNRVLGLLVGVTGKTGYSMEPIALIDF